MPDFYSKLSGNGRTVIPKPIRERLGLVAGDILAFRIVDRRRVEIEKAQQTTNDPFASFGEWSSAEDEGLYRDL